MLRPRSKASEPTIVHGFGRLSKKLPDLAWGFPYLVGFAGFYKAPLPIVSIVVPFWGYLLGSLIESWLNQKKELEWRL